MAVYYLFVWLIVDAPMFGSWVQCHWPGKLVPQDHNMTCSPQERVTFTFYSYNNKLNYLLNLCYHPHTSSFDVCPCNPLSSITMLYPKTWQWITHANDINNYMIIISLTRRQHMPKNCIRLCLIDQWLQWERQTNNTLTYLKWWNLEMISNIWFSGKFAPTLIIFYVTLNKELHLLCTHDNDLLLFLSNSTSSCCS